MYIQVLLLWSACSLRITLRNTVVRCKTRDLRDALLQALERTYASISCALRWISESKRRRWHPMVYWPGWSLSNVDGVARGEAVLVALQRRFDLHADPCSFHDPTWYVPASLSCSAFTACGIFNNPFCLFWHIYLRFPTYLSSTIPKVKNKKPILFFRL